MSRRKHFGDQPHVTYGQIVLQCPHGHPLGAIVATAMGGLWYLERSLADGRDIPAVELEAGHKISLSCPACVQAGRRPDYQASWAAVAALLRLERSDPRSERQVLTLS